MRLKFKVKTLSLTAAKMSLKCSRIKMLTVQKKALKFQNKFKRLELKLQQESKKYETFHHKFILASLATKD